MTRPVRNLAAILILALALSAARVGAQGNPNKPMITDALVSSDQTTLFVDGVNLGARPSVMLGDTQVGSGAQLAGVAVDTAGRRLTAQLPPLVPGTYLLQVTNGNWTAQFALT